MQEYAVFYHHTFGFDTFEASSYEDAKRQAVAKLKEEFSDHTDEELAKGVKINETITARKWEDFIEEISIWDEDEEN